MAVNFSDVVKQGNVKMKRKTLPGWKSRFLILRKSSSRGPLRLDCFKSEKISQISDSIKKVIELKNVLGITLLPPNIKRYALTIAFADGRFITMAFDSEREVAHWEAALRSTCLPSNRPLTAPTGMDLLCDASESSNQDVFNVYLLPNLSLSIQGECLLQCTTETLYILDAENPTRRLMGWPLNTLRRYGRDGTKFTFESGRSSPSGEGIFIFNTIFGEQIYQKVHLASLAISKAYRFSTGVQLPGPVAATHVPITRTNTLPIPSLEDRVDGLPQALPPRQVNFQRRATLDCRRRLPPIPPAH